MKITDAFWIYSMNLLEITCHCGHIFKHRCDEKRITCLKCRYGTDIEKLRIYYRKYGFGNVKTN